MAWHSRREHAYNGAHVVLLSGPVSCLVPNIIRTIYYGFNVIVLYVPCNSPDTYWFMVLNFY